MRVVLFIAVTVVVGFHFGTSACPTHCKAGATCDADDSGCPECDPAYYGRQCQHRLECRFTTKGAEYRGLINTTSSGRTCQRWDSQSPHIPLSIAVAGEVNYCRNPDGEPAPWCYTTDPKMRWELCNVKMCNTQCLSPPLNVPFADFINPPSDGFAVGFDVIIGCMTGYEAPATVNLTCQSDRTWTQSPLPTCNRIRCSTPSLAKNSHVSNPKPPYQYGDQIYIVCNAGYTLQGQSTLTCQSDKDWNASIPTCNRVRCSTPSLAKNSHVSNPKPPYQYGDQITIVCNAGYTLQGQSTLTCQSDKAWNASIPTCNINECPAPASVPNSSMLGNKAKYVYQDTVTITCNTGYTLQGQGTMTCQADKTWSNAPSCAKINCVDLKLSSNVLISSPTYEDKVSFQCREGFILRHNNRLICQTNKFWDKEEPFCMEICNTLSTPQWVGLTVGLNLANTLLSIFVTVLFMRRFTPKAKKHDRPSASISNTRNAALDNYNEIDITAKEEPHIYDLPE